MSTSSFLAPSSARFLRHVLIADALSCLGCGALQIVFTAVMARITGLDAALLLGTGVFLLLYAAIVAFVGTRMPAVPRAPVWLFIVGNLGWAAACVGLLISGWVQPTAWGTAYVLLQAVTVLALADLQWVGLRRQPVAGLRAVTPA